MSDALRLGKRPTIADVARAANVSIGTVSNVINGTRPVSETARERVRAAADALGFQINSVAQTLRRRSSRTIGLCTTRLTTTYLRDLAIELDAIAAQNGYELIQVQTHQDPERELARVQSLMGRQVDGLILLPSLRPGPSLDAIARRHMPVVVVDREMDDPRFSYVVVDNRDAMRQVVRALFARGHRRILFVAQNLAVITTRHRIEGLDDEVRESGGALTFHAVERGDDEARYRQRLAQLLHNEPRPTAIVTGNSNVALWTLKALQAFGMRWPDDVALATFDDPDWAAVLAPPLSTVRSPTREMADAVWRVMAVHLEGRAEPSQVFSLTARFIERESSSTPPRRLTDNGCASNQ